MSKRGVAFNVQVWRFFLGLTLGWYWDFGFIAQRSGSFVWHAGPLRVMFLDYGSD